MLYTRAEGVMMDEGLITNGWVNYNRLSKREYKIIKGAGELRELQVKRCNKVSVYFPERVSNL